MKYLTIQTTVISTCTLVQILGRSQISAHTLLTRSPMRPLHVPNGVYFVPMDGCENTY